MTTLLAVLVVPAAANVPLNDRLVAGPDAAGWAAYDRPWARWNHVRAVSCAVSCLLAVLALVVA